MIAICCVSLCRNMSLDRNPHTPSSKDNPDLHGLCFRLCVLMSEDPCFLCIRNMLCFHPPSLTAVAHRPNLYQYRHCKDFRCVNTIEFCRMYNNYARTSLSNTKLWIQSFGSTLSYNVETFCCAPLLYPLTSAIPSFSAWLPSTQA